MSKRIHDVPQVTWENTEKLLGATRRAGVLSQSDAQIALGDVQTRETTYAAQALRFLGWTKAHKNHEVWPLILNSSGEAAADNAVLRHQDAWDLLVNWSPVENLLKGDTGAAIKDLENEGLGIETAKRRLGTVMNWLKSLGTPADVAAMKSGRAASVATQAKRQASQQRNRRRAAEEATELSENFADLARLMSEDRLPLETLPEGTDEVVLAKARKHHGKFARAVKKLWRGQCAVTGSSLLVYASHIKPWAKSSGEEKTDPENGLLLDERWDRLFDAGYVSFSDSGAVMLSVDVDVCEWVKRGITGEERLSRPPSEKTKIYLAHHRTEVFKGGIPTESTTPMLGY